MSDLRTAAQKDFDLATHGWAFCNAKLLAGRIEHLHNIAFNLIPEDPRHELLKTMMSRLERLEKGEKL